MAKVRFTRTDYAVAIGLGIAFTPIASLIYLMYVTDYRSKKEGKLKWKS